MFLLEFLQRPSRTQRVLALPVTLRMRVFGTTLASFRYEMHEKTHEKHVLSAEMPHMRPETLKIHPQIPQSDLRMTSEKKTSENLRNRSRCIL